MKFEPGHSFESLRDSVLLVPSVSIANIPQLALDLLLHSLLFEKVATLSDSYLFPFVSPTDHAVGSETRKGISLALEVFTCKEKKITLIQQRSPVLPGFSNRHVSEVVLPFLEACLFRQMIVLHLFDAGLASGAGPSEIQVFNSEDILSESLQSLRLTKTSTDSSIVISRDTNPYIKSLIENIPDGSIFSLMVIYAYEGDNIHDARVMSYRISEMLSLHVREWRTPTSWHGVYGDKHVPLAMEEGMYG